MRIRELKRLIENVDDEATVKVFKERDENGDRVHEDVRLELVILFDDDEDDDDALGEVSVAFLPFGDEG